MTAQQIIIFIASVLSLSVSIWSIWLCFFRPAESAEKAASRLWAEIARARKYEEAFLREKEKAIAINKEMDNAGVPVADDNCNIVFFKGIPCALKTGFYTAPEDYKDCTHAWQQREWLERSLVNGGYDPKEYLK